MAIMAIMGWPSMATLYVIGVCAKKSKTKLKIVHLIIDTEVMADSFVFSSKIKPSRGGTSEGSTGLFFMFLESLELRNGLA